MKVAMLSPIAWRTPPVDYGPWERVTSLLTEGLLDLGVDVTLFATGTSVTKGRLRSVCPLGYEEDPSVNPKVWECLHISELLDEADEYDLIHNQFDFLPLTYSGNISTPIVTTIHGFSSEQILPVYKKYNDRGYYVSVSDADRHPALNYIRTIYHGIDLQNFSLKEEPDDYILFFGRIHPDKGTKEAIEIAKKSGRKLIIAGIIQDQAYFAKEVKPHLNEKTITYIGSAGPLKRNELLGGALALLHPINFAEPFGLSVVEAMACGTPVVAFNKGSMTELIQDGENGFLVTSVEEAVAALEKITTIDRAFCRTSVESQFSAEKMAQNYLDVYKEIVNREKREDHRPWGFYTVLADEPCHKVKRIVVQPGKRLSLQRHQRREEHWYVIEGEAFVTLDEKEIHIKTGKSVNIPKRSLHRVENRGKNNLVFIETQTGNYFGEDDIERFEDDYGRS